MDNNFFTKFSPALKQLLILAEKIAGDLGDQLDTQHLIFAMVSMRDNLASDILNNFEITPSKIDVLSRLINRKSKKLNLGVAESLKTALLSAIKITSSLGQNQVEIEHLLLALVSDKSFKAYEIIERAGADPEKIKKQLDQIFSELKQAVEHSRDFFGQLDPKDNLPEEGFEFSPEEVQYSPTMTQGNANKEKSLLETYGTDLNEMASKDQLDPVIGREKEIDRVVQILSRRTKNNPILIGEPGVGKTSIVEGLALRIVKGRVPRNLLNKRIIMLDLGGIVAGTMFRGQFEARFKKIIEEIIQNGDIIIFLDELHTVVGTGSAEGSLDAANLLKPMLTKGQLRLIGATTFDEYKKNIEKDKAFERRFQIVKVLEPSVPETVRILKGLQSKYENYHGIKYEDAAIEAAVNLSDRYIADRFLPDKAIDLMDEAAASTNVISKNSSEIISLQKRLAEIAKQKEDAVLKENYQGASSLREEEVKINMRLQELTDAEDATKAKFVTAAQIAEIVANTTGIPVTDLKTTENIRLVNLEGRLKREVIGQEQAIKIIAQAIKRSRVGISDPNKPIGSFIFLGPTGVGKTELARVLAKLVFGSEKALVKIDMSEFMVKHNVARLVGAPAGYVGYDEGGKLTETIRHQPYSLILFDEIEKAHPDIFNLLLQILEDGYLTDAKGRRVNFKNTLIILTSNLGSKILSENSIGFIANKEEKQSKLSEQLLENIKKNLPPEFINRLDKIVVFNELDKDDLKKIVNLRLKDLEKRLKHIKVSLDVSDEAKKRLLDLGFDQKFGARPLRRAISEYIESKVSDLALKEKSLAGRTIKVDRQGDEITVVAV
jgi:ATP-dependent Clp protease ATP-binding subunit ClpC